MRWRAADADAYLQSADYIDTAVIPLISITSSGGLKEAVEQGESTQLLSEELERQLKGRVYLFPSYTYVDIDQSQIALLQKLKDEVMTNFRHVLFLTADEKWKYFEIGSDVIYIPAVPFEHMKDSLKRKIADDKCREILNVLLQKWNNS
ncbi:YpiF family protein [Bacillus sp. ICE1]|uniref:YpiF family protein n=1 Tax=Bacillus TaxID=1386 RepID=UPI001E3EA4CC|nr:MULTISPECIES: YpiF family protein [unclassified Bacillus (in: firmicutes)]MCC8303194.1 YpiF family protein [Bacillus sp. AF12]MDV9078785.1 YpiF family protein [Bacillus sp. ICE1]